MNLRKLKSEWVANGGFTYSLNFGNFNGEPAWSVAKDKATERVYDNMPSDKEVLEFVTENIEALSSYDYALGGWFSNGRYYLDVAQLFDKDEFTLERVLSIGQERCQEAIFDLETGDTIPVKPVQCFK